MGLFDAFSASDETKKFRQGNKAFQQYAEGGRGDIKEYYDVGSEALKNAEPRALDVLGHGVDQAIDRSAGLYDKAAAAWHPLLKQGTQGIQSHWEMLQNPDSIYDSELYRSREAAGLDAINRGYNARGMLASGNNTQDQIDYMRQGGLDYFNTLMNQHQPYFGLATNAAGGVSNVRADQARNTMNLFDQLGANKANVMTGTAGRVADLNRSEGDALASIRLKQGDSASNMYTNMANAQSAADANLWGALMGVGNLATSAYRGYRGV